MIMQYDDMVLQIRDRLVLSIPQVAPRIALVKCMGNAQEDIEGFLAAQEVSKVFIGYSGSTAEGGRTGADYVKTLTDATQEEYHTFEIYVCTKRLMNEDLTKPSNTMYRLMWTIKAALRGLRFYRRVSGVPVKNSDNEQTGPLFFIENYMDANYPGVVAVCRFQCKEDVTPDPSFDAEEIWGIYEEITIEEYSQQDGTTPSIAGGSTEEVEIT